jgi:hypothetical protein
MSRRSGPLGSAPPGFWKNSRTDSFVVVADPVLPLLRRVVGGIIRARVEITTLVVAVMLAHEMAQLVARGRASGIIVVAATQRPSSDIIPTSLRDLFGYRWAFRCTTDTSSHIVLGHGWASREHTAAAITPDDQGVGLPLAEGGEPRRLKAAHLSDEQVHGIAEQAATRRLAHRLTGGVA